MTKPPNNFAPPRPSWFAPRLVRAKIALLLLIGAACFAATAINATAQAYIPIWYTNAHNWTIDIGNKRYGVVEQRPTYNPPKPWRSTTVYFHGKAIFGTKMRAEYLVALIVAPLILAVSMLLLRRAGRKPATEP